MPERFLNACRVGLSPTYRTWLAIAEVSGRLASHLVSIINAEYAYLDLYSPRLLSKKN